MRALLQRVIDASVTVGDKPVASIGKGLLIFLGVDARDGAPQVEAMGKKIAGLRLFDDAQGKTNLSCEDVGGEYLVVSQFTLCADLSKGKRPGFEAAMKPPESERLYLAFCERLRALTGRPVKTGEFGASMTVALRNDGPATFWVELAPTSTPPSAPAGKAPGPPPA
jgi:D-tyrosyl-tRNA(Tyr) deacylase